eukprot:gnl/Chilomastix_caulleri/237.p1 GENE.gnl/Chilomastix_caulleri/237~~gnl/Chilomastix_caulleri/237.p1  ORF type:complete len:372 (+),score=92.40 gnl/Chilomastix_caulleri/237:103-1218(+)
MILLLISLAVGALAITANGNPYSKVVCDYLSTHGFPTACSNQLTAQKNKYCSGENSFFTESEIQKFIDGTKIDIDATKAELEITKKEMTGMFDEMKKMCMGVKECTNVMDALKALIEIPLDSAYDGFLISYTMANTFNLGSVCLAKDPEDNFQGILPVVTDSIIKRLEELCNSTTDMMIGYFYKIADALGKLDSSLKAAMKEIVKEFEAELKTNNTMCHDMAMSIPFVSGTGLSMQLTQLFDSAFSEMDGMTEYIQCVMQNPTNVEYCDKFDAKEIEKFITGRLNIVSTKLAAAGDTMVVSKSGYDVYGAAKANPEYKDMTPMPNGLGGGLEAWAIAVIVIAVVAVLAGVGVAVFCLVIKPKRKGSNISVN